MYDIYSSMQNKLGNCMKAYFHHIYALIKSFCSLIAGNVFLRVYVLKKKGTRVLQKKDYNAMTFLF